MLDALDRRDFLDRLQDAVPDVLTEPASIERYAHDEAEWAPYTLPAAVVRATSTEDVRRLVLSVSSTPCRWCRAVRAPGCPAAPTPSRAPWC